MRLKVSNVCQLLDKSKFWGTTRNGVTVTNNRDGTFTINGTATYDTWFLQPVFQFQTSNPGYHTYLLDIGQYSGNANAHGVVYFYDDNADSSVALIGTENSSAVIRKINGPIAGRGTIIQARFAIVVLKGVTVTNWTIRPQLFDLTEMYGAGNEPTTVAQFRQDFPNEMYEYSPECWKKFRRLKYVTETKNLFDISKVVETNYVKRSGDGLICSLYGTPIGKLGTICPSLKVGDTVTVSFKTVSAGVAGNFIQTDNHILRNGEKFTVSETGLTSQFYLYNTSYDCRDIPNKTTYYELQLEKGSTASPYQPYGYLPLRTGRYRTETRNLFDINAEMHDVNKPEYYIEVMGNIVKTNYDISHVGHPYIEVPVEIGETYTFSCNAYRSSDIINVYSRVRYPDNTIVTYISNGPVKKTFTATQSSIQVCFGIDTYGSFDTSQFALIYNIQLEKGTTATHYQPYKYIYFH